MPDDIVATSGPGTGQDVSLPISVPALLRALASYLEVTGTANKFTEHLLTAIRDARDREDPNRGEGPGPIIDDGEGPGAIIDEGT